MIYNKYKAKKVVVDGIKFDSKLESNIYIKLKEIKSKLLDFEYNLQPRFLLMDKFKLNNKTFRSVEYIADFEIISNGNSYIIDVKGMETPVFKIKAKLFAKKFGKEIICIKSLKRFEEWFFKMREEESKLKCL